MKRFRLVVALVVLALIGLATVASADTPRATVEPNLTTVGVYVLRQSGFTEAYIDCGKKPNRDWWDRYDAVTMDGNATMFMVNQSPRKITCTISIYPVKSITQSA